MRVQLRRLWAALGAAVLLAWPGATLAATPKVHVKPITIGLVSLFANDEWSAQFFAGVHAMVHMFPDVRLISTQASYNQAEMVTQLQTVIGEHPNVIIVNHAASSPALEPEIKKAVAEGIKVITVSLVMPVKGVSQAHQDNYQLAMLSLNALAKGIHNHGNIVVVWVGGFAPMIERMQALQAFLKTHPGIHVIAQYGDASNTTISDTISRTEAALRANPGKVAAIWASWDQFALGAVQAVEDMHVNVPVYGIDVSNQDVAVMRAKGSPWRATAATDTFEYGAIVTRYAILDAYGQPVPAHIWVPGALITQATLPKPGESIHAYFERIFPNEDKVAFTPFLQALAHAK